MGFLKAIFGLKDRTATATERITAALEGMADDVEEARGNLRRALGLEQGAEETPALPPPTQKRAKR